MYRSHNIHPILVTEFEQFLKQKKLLHDGKTLTRLLQIIFKILELLIVLQNLFRKHLQIKSFKTNSDFYKNYISNQHNMYVNRNTQKTQ